MTDTLAVPESPGPDRSRRPSTEAILTLFTGALTGIGGVYVGTHSVLVTVIAAAVAALLAAMVLILHK